ncbi:hypothetical protein UlMin_020903, partial [Ulmus minor]
MAALCSSTSLFFSQPNQRAVTVFSQPKRYIFKFCVNASSSEAVTVSEVVSRTQTTSLGFKNLTETFWVDVHGAEEEALFVELDRPLGKTEVENVAIRVELSNGCVGWGEAAGTGKLQLQKGLGKAKEACEFLRKSSPMTLSLVLEQIGAILPGQEFASVRAGVEMALIDAVANSIDVPLWRLFGGVSNTLTTAVTIPIISPAKASALAATYFGKGFTTIRLSIGSNQQAELEVIKAIRAAQPHCSFILDANGKYTSEEAIMVLEKLNEMDVSPVLFEQPVHEDDWRGLADLSAVARGKYGINVAADESCKTLSDVRKVVEENIVDVINIKLAKFGVLGALQVIDIARKSGLNLVMDSLVETRLATGFAGHLAAGFGCFKYVNLDAPFLLSEDPVFGGYEVSGPVYSFTNARGQGGFLKRINVAR